MKVSIIIPIYNVEKYIEECLQSVASQTAQDDVECILVNDCGTDNSVAIAEDFVRKYSGSIKFLILHHEHNRGLSAARNTGIIQAKGDYVFFLDSDDKLFPNSISDLLKVADKYPDAEMIQGGMTPGFELSKDYLPEYSNSREWIRRGLCTNKISDPACNKFVKRDFIVNNNLFFIAGYLQEDTLWNYQLQKCISSVAFCFETIYWYRYNPNGIMHGMSALREAKSFARLFNYVFNDLINCDKIEPYEIQFLVRNAKMVYGYIGKHEGRKLLVTQNNSLFNAMTIWTTGLSRLRSTNVILDSCRKSILWLIKIFILNPNLKRLCDKQKLLQNFVEIDYSQPV